MTIKELRKKLSVTIKEAAEVSGVPLRTYIRYKKMKNMVRNNGRIIELSRLFMQLAFNFLLRKWQIISKINLGDKYARTN